MFGRLAADRTVQETFFTAKTTNHGMIPAVCARQSVAGLETGDRFSREFGGTARKTLRRAARMIGVTERNSTVRGRELGVRLRYYRTAAGLSERGAGGKLGVSVSTICRIERGIRNPGLEEVASLLAYYDVRGTERTELLDMAREVDQRGWWYRINPEAGRMINLLMSQESRATEITSFELDIIPGLLQSDLYATALARECGVLPENEIKPRVEARMLRRRNLFKDNPVQLLAIIDEAALHRTVGSTAVMHRQLDYLVHLATKPNIIIRLIPREQSGSIAPFHAFHMLKFAEAPTVVQTEDLVAEHYYEEPREIKAFEDAVFRLSAWALSTGESVELMTRLIHALEEHPDVLPQVGWPQVAKE